MTTFTWQDKHIPIYPWDTIESILYRIAEKEKVSVSYLQIQQDLLSLLDDHPWEEDVDIHITVKNMTKDWGGSDMISTMKTLQPEERILYLRYKKDDIDEQLWETLFQHEFQDISYTEWVEKVRQMETLEKEKKKFNQQLSKWYKELSMEEPKNIVGWKSEKHCMQYQIQDPRSIEELFSNLKMGSLWRLAILHQKLFQWGEKDLWIVKMRRLKDPTLEQLCRDIQDNLPTMEIGIYLYHQQIDTPIFIQSTRMKNKQHVYDIELETSTDFPDLVEKTQEALDVHNMKKQSDIGMIGHFIIPQLYIDFSLFQDMCMNDPIISHFLHVNELVKSSFDVVLKINFHQNMKDILQIETIKNYDFSIKNTHRQSGFQVMVSLHSPIAEKNLDIFFLFIRQMIGRFIRLREELLKEYARFIPNIKTILEKKQKSIVKNINLTRPEYISKYPRMFVRNLYSVICQKPLQPTLLTEDEIYDIPKERYILFPPQPIAEINPEYYYCPNKDYPFAGLKEVDLKGQNTFINLAPCCFNSPQDKDNERKLAKLRTKDDENDEEEKEKRSSKINIILGKFLIKHPGQLGSIRPPSMNRFFMAYDPFVEYFRIGTQQSPSSLIYCMLTRRNMMGLTTPYNVNDVRIKIANDKNCVDACLQENPGLHAEQVRDDIANPNVYFDPRRFYRAIELYFGVRIIIFTKTPNITEEDAEILLPFSMRTHYTNHSDLPFTIVFEHWGGKTNILSKFKYPHCELIGFKPLTEPSMHFDFDPKGIFQLFDNIVFPFDGNHSIQPFYRKECWFFRHIIGQTPDPLGKIRWLHFQYYNQDFYAEIYPPLAIQDDISVGELPQNLPILNARSLLRFLNKFDHWEKIYISNENNIIYWTVSQDNVLRKNFEEKSKLFLTFACRLEKSPIEIPEEQLEDLQKYIKFSRPNLMLFKPSLLTTSFIHHNERVATILSQLSISAFSHFLKENKVQQDAVEIDLLLNTFQQQKIKIETKHVYPEQIQADYNGFITQNGKLVLPSFVFWEKIMFQLKWLMFYQPQYLFDTEKTLPKRLQEIGDFVQQDPQHYYCNFNQLINVLTYSIENLYPIVSCPIDELPTICKNQQELYVIWYEKNVSPYPHPSLVLLYPSYNMTLYAVRIWRQEHRILPSSMMTEDMEEQEQYVHDWEPTLNLWKPSLLKDDETPIFRARVKENEYLLFFPME